MSNSSGQLAVINLNPLTVMAALTFMVKMHFLGHFLVVYMLNQLQNTHNSICNLIACLSFHKHHVSWHFFVWTCAQTKFLRLSCFLVAVVRFPLGSLQLRNFWESIVTMGNSYHQVAKCNEGKFPYEFFTQTVWHLFFCYFWVQSIQSLSSGYHWKDLFCLQNFVQAIPSLVKCDECQWVKLQR